MSSLCTFRVTSYNCHGFSAKKRTYIKTLLQSSDVMFSKEHWLSTDQSALLGDIDANFVYTVAYPVLIISTFFEGRGLLADARFCGDTILELIF